MNHRKLTVEALEPRRLLSFVFDFGDSDVAEATRPEDAPGGKKPGAPAIDLGTVAAHELGHSLGLAHSNHPSCGQSGQPLMCPYYLGPAFQLQAEDTTRIQTLYPEFGPGTGGTAWASPAITFSYMPDGTAIDQGGKKGSELFATMNMTFESTATWQAIYVASLDLWAAATRADGLATQLTFTQMSDGGQPYNTSGAAQGDPRFGDIRFGAHKMDGAGGTLAHAWYPNSIPVGGDAHFAKEENWKNLSGSASSSSGGSGSGGGSGDLTMASQAEIETIAVIVSLSPPVSLDAELEADDDAGQSLIDDYLMQQATQGETIAIAPQTNTQIWIETDSSDQDSVDELDVILGGGEMQLLLGDFA